MNKTYITLTPIALVATMMMCGAHAEDVLLPEVRVRDTSTMVSKKDIPAATESVSKEQMADSINVVNVEDALKYLPSVNIRKRFEGDRNGIIATRTSGTLESAKSLVYGDGILLSMLLGNSYSYPPRWFMVAPEEVERIDVTYGPFSAIYPGNSAGVVVDMVTRMPTQFEGHARVLNYLEPFELFGTKSTYKGNEQSATLGDRQGALSWWLGLNRSETSGQPASYALLAKTSNVATSAYSSTNSNYVPTVTGAYLYNNQAGAPTYVAGGYAQDNAVQKNAKLKLSYDFTPSIIASYTLADYQNDGNTTTQTYLTDSAGNPFYGNSGGTVNLNTSLNTYSLTNSTLKPSSYSQEHLMQAFALRQQSGGEFDWELSTSHYSFLKDLTLAPTDYRGATSAVAAGTATKQDGTGWYTYDLKGIWRPSKDYGLHKLIFGYHIDQFKLSQLVMNTSAWASDTETTQKSFYGGKTQTQAIYVQDQWGFSKDWVLIPGIRYENWRAFDGKGTAASGSSRTDFNARSDNYLSPKLALMYEGIESVRTRLSWGRGYRMPTVGELYAGSVSSSGIATQSDPNLKAEKNDTIELSFEKFYDKGLIRTSVFEEQSQNNILQQTISNTNTYQNVDLVRTRGLELVGQSDGWLLGGLKLTGSLTYARAVIVSDTQKPEYVGTIKPRIPNLRGSILAAYSPDEHWVYSLGARYSSRMVSTLGGTYDQVAYGGVSKFFIIDTKVRYKFDKNWSASVGVNDLNNCKSYVVHPNSTRTYMADLRYDYK